MAIAQKEKYNRPLYSRPAYVKWYKTAQWQRLRRKQLSKKPVCEFHEKQNETMPANIVDHIRPHKGQASLFFDAGNLQSLCKECHDAVKQKMEKSGDYGGDINGIGVNWR